MRSDFEFKKQIELLAVDIHMNAICKGWYEQQRTDGDLVALMHSELSEALESVRHGNPPDDHIPQFSGLEAEMADVIIRVLDFCVYRGLRIGDAILAKHEYNKSRPYRHGNKKL